MYKSIVQFRPLLLTDVLNKSANNFNLLKLIATVGILVGYAHTLLPQSLMNENAFSLDDVSTIALNFFFFLSGLLLTDSLIQKPEPLFFLMRRFVRIFPTLLIFLLINVLLIGPLFTKLSLSDYFSHRETWHYFSSHLNLTFTQSHLPGVFQNHDLDIALSSLHYGAICCLYVAAFSGFGFFALRIVANLGCVGLILLTFIEPDYLLRFTESPLASMFAMCFLLGTFFAMNKQLIKVDASRVFLAWLLMWLMNDSDIQHFFFYIALFYTLLYLSALKFVVHRLSLKFDASFGMFLYGFMIQQCLYSIFPEISIHWVQWLSIPFALLAGMATWFFIEKPCIKLGQKMTHSSTKYKQIEHATSFVKITREKMLKERALNTEELV